MVGTSARPLYYWDTCLFIAWLKDEARPERQMEGLADIMARFMRREVSLCTSVLTLTEISVAKIPAGTENQLDEVMQRPNFSRISVDIRIARLARDLRNFYLRQPEYGGKSLTVPDSLHVATAIQYRATELHTFDENDKGKYKSLGLIPLSGNVAGHKLTICMPPPPAQLRLGLGS